MVRSTTRLWSRNSIVYNRTHCQCPKRWPDITPWFRTPLSGWFWIRGLCPGVYVRQSWNLAFTTPFPVTENDIVHSNSTGGYVLEVSSGLATDRGFWPRGVMSTTRPKHIGLHVSDRQFAVDQSTPMMYTQRTEVWITASNIHGGAYAQCSLVVWHVFKLRCLARTQGQRQKEADREGGDEGCSSTN